MPFGVIETKSRLERSPLETMISRELGASLRHSCLVILLSLTPIISVDSTKKVHGIFGEILRKTPQTHEKVQDCKSTASVLVQRNYQALPIRVAQMKRVGRQPRAKPSGYRFPRVRLLRAMHY